MLGGLIFLLIVAVIMFGSLQLFYKLLKKYYRKKGNIHF